MRVGVLGTGMVGHAVASRLVELGHDVVMGSRSATNEKAAAWPKLPTTASPNVAPWACAQSSISAIPI